MLLFPESGPKKNLRGNGFTKTVTLHLRSIGPNVKRHMAYFALPSESRRSRPMNDWSQMMLMTIAAIAALSQTQAIPGPCGLGLKHHQYRVALLRAGSCGLRWPSGWPCAPTRALCVKRERWPYFEHV